MTSQLIWTREADRQFQDILTAAEGRKPGSKQAGLAKQVKKALANLQRDPRHPGLRTHRYSGLQHPYEPDEPVWEAYVQNNTPAAYRIFWCYGPAEGQLTIIAITAHP